MWASKMDDNWETHVSPLMMGVGMGEMQSMGEMQQNNGQDISLQQQQHHHQEMGQSSHHLDLSQGIHQDIDEMGREIVHHDIRAHHGDQGLDDVQDYYSHQVGVSQKKNVQEFFNIT